MRGDVYEQSRWLAVKAAQMYYLENCSQDQIAAQLRISKSTVSRLLKRAREQGYIQFLIPDNYEGCLDAEESLHQRFNLMDVIVVPERFASELSDGTSEPMRHLVAMEGARYLQRILTPRDILGIGWGRTMGLLVNYLNPCQRTNIPFVTMHGSVKEVDPALDVEYLVRRITMAFGGRYLSLNKSALCASEAELAEVMREESVRKVFQMMDKITITISSLGSFYPTVTSPLADTQYFSDKELNYFCDHDARCDLMLRFIDKDGKEIESSIQKRTLGVDLDTLRRIPCKIIVANGKDKAAAVLTALKARLISVLIIDEALAQELLNME